MSYINVVLVTGLIFVSTLVFSMQPVSAAGEEWYLSLTASTATMGANPNLILGTNGSATNGFDAGIDVPTAPPPPPPLDLSAYFSIDDDLFPKLDADYRAPAASIQWKLKASSEEAILFTWDTGNVPGNVELRLTGAGLNIDMKTVGQADLPSEGSYTLTVTATTTSTETFATSTPTPTSTPSATPTPTATSTSSATPATTPATTAGGTSTATPTPDATSAIEPTPTYFKQGPNVTQTPASTPALNPDSTPSSNAANGTGDANWSVIGAAIAAGFLIFASTIWILIKRRR